MIVSVDNAEHYIWGEVCDGWRLIQRDDISIIQERVPPGATEVMHYHNQARQFFFILQGEGTMTFVEQEIALKKGQLIEIAPQVRHQFKNQSSTDVHFLVISVPTTRTDRVNLGEELPTA